LNALEDRPTIRRSAALKLAFSAVTALALVLGLINDTLGIKSSILGSDSRGPHSSSGPDSSTIAKNLNFSNRIEYQTGMGLDRDVTGAMSRTMIRWRPIFVVSNSGTVPVAIEDIDFHFPERKVEGTGDVVQLKKDSEEIIAYQDIRDFRAVKKLSDEGQRSDEEFSRTQRSAVIPWEARGFWNLSNFTPSR
jgi:hypothetical protein